MKVIKVFLFGPPRVSREDKAVPINRRKMLALLAYLLVTGQPHSREALATLLWPDYDQSSALANLRRDLSRLKEILGQQVLRIEREKVWIDPQASIWSDLATFEVLLQKARDHGHFNPAGEIHSYCQFCQQHLEEAERLFSDHFLAGFNVPDSAAFDEWQFFQVERLRGLLVDVLKHRVQWQIEQGAYENALPPARRWVALDPLHEPAQRWVMQLYAWSGQLSAALRQYQLLFDLLQEELGVEPEAETSALYEAIRTRRITPPQPRPPVVSAKPVAVVGDPPLQGADRFTVLNHLSTGGFGEIYRGLDRLTGSEVAIKRLVPQLVARQPEVVDRFLREADALSQLSHPNIVPMLAFYESEGEYNLVMEYMPGGTLRDRLDQEKRLPVEQALALALELADALSRAHHLHILHRDLKPENVLIDAAGHPRLIDFGLAMFEAQDVRITQAGMLIGSPAYMSPEALRGQAIDSRSDIWSFGVLLYEMLAGQPPFRGEQIPILIHQILTEPPTPLQESRPELSPALEQLIVQMLEKDRDRRLPGMRQVAAELEAIRDGKTAPAPRKVHGKVNTIHSPTPAPSRMVKLPTHSTPLIGRETELRQIQELMKDPAARLITLVGPGGIGKTRLSVEAASLAAKELFDGAVFISLASVNTVDFLVPAIGNALNLRFSPGADPKEQLINRLRWSSLLLVLDNFEHLLDGSGLLSELLAASPQLHLLVTSRERLSIQEEWVFEVNGLPYPPPGEAVADDAHAWLQNFSAVQLFVERARRADPNLILDSPNLNHIVRICQLVEGMPLAIELAAPWLRVMSCEEIVHELERGLNILTTTMRNLPERHRSLQLVFDQSWQSLTPAEQAVLARLSVFHNGCTREAAEKVAEARSSELMVLVDKALVRHRNDRFEMHELVRQYSANRLAENPPMEAQARGRHHRYFLEWMGQMGPWLKGGRQMEANQKIIPDLANLHAAWHSAVGQGDHPALLQAAEPYWLYHEFRGLLAQGEASFRLACESITDQAADPVLSGFLLAAHGSLLSRLWQLERGHERMEQGIHLLRQAKQLDYEKTAFALAWFAFVNVMNGRYEEAVGNAEESLSYFPQTGDRWTQAGSLRLLGAAYLYRGQLQRAQEYLHQCVEICRSIGELRIRTYAASNLGVIHLWFGQFDQARAYFEESLRVSKSCNDRLSRADALCEFGRLFLATGEFDSAVGTARKCISLYHQLGRKQVSLANIVLGKALWLKGQENGEEAIAEGLEAARSVNHMPDMATGLEGLGTIALYRHEFKKAEQYFREALTIWKEVGHEPEIATLLCRLGHSLLTAGAPDRHHIQDLFKQALRLAVKHRVGPIAITAEIGLAALQVHNGEGDHDRLTAILAFARRSPITPYEARGWVDNLLIKLQADPAQIDPDALAIMTWQTVADLWEVSVVPA